MKSLEEALEERDKFLEENPQLKQYQKEIDEILDKCTSNSDRLMAVTLILAGKMTELHKKLNTLSKVLDATS